MIIAGRVALWPLILIGILAAAAAQAAEQSQELIPANEAADIRAVIGTIEGAINGEYAVGVRPALRDAHAKSHGCVKGDFSVDANLPDVLRVGVFAEPHKFTAWMRFSNGSGTPHDDASGDGRGMAIKLTGVQGPKILIGEADAQTQDFVMINYPSFFIRNVADYVPFTSLSLQGRSSEFFATHQHEKSVVDAITSMSVDNVFDERYFSMSAYLLGDKYMKFSTKPVDCVSGATIVGTTNPAQNTDPNYLREGMVNWLNAKDACFKFGIQLQTNPAMQPVEDPTIVWNESDAPFVDVASIRIPKQNFDSDAQQAFCENLSFTPWHALPVERPVGGINRLREGVYEAISELRHKLNIASRVEPTGNENFN